MSRLCRELWVCGPKSLLSHCRRLDKRDWEVHSVASIEQFAGAIRHSQRTPMLLFEPRGFAISLNDDGLEHALELGDVLVVVRRARPALAEAMRIALRYSSTSLRATPLDGVMEALAASAMRAPLLPIVDLFRSISARVDTEIRMEMGAAVVLSNRHRRVEELATALGVPSRTLNWKVRRHLNMSPRDLIDHTCAIACAWRLDVGRMSPSQVSAYAGFSSTRTLREFLGRVCSIGPQRIARLGAFQQVYESFIARLSQLGTSD